MANYNSYDVLSEKTKQNYKRKAVGFSGADPHKELKNHFLIRFNAIDLKIKTIEILVNRVVEKFNV